MLEAGAAPCTGLTALQGINHLRLQEGATVLIFGGSGAVGTLAIQFAKYRQARVLATASRLDAEALVLRLGAEAAIDARRDDAVERLRALAPMGLDAVLALAGGDALERCLKLVRSGGRVVYPNGVEPEPEPRRGIRVLAYDAKGDTRSFAELEEVFEEAGIDVPIARVYPLAAAAKAHERLEQGQVVGRIVLQIAADR
jgi:NADPH:quinone reductase-like Zn-dependent oxidoreductase